MDDVALDAGVSRATVSRVLSGSDLVIGPTRQRVLESVHRLGYLPNTAAQSLARSWSSMLGLLLRDPRVAAYGLLHATLQREVTAAGLEMTTVTPLPDDAGRTEGAALRQLLGLRVAGLLIASGVVSPQVLEPFRSVLPVVSVGRPEPDSSLAAVSYDEVTNGAMLAEAVFNAGHRQVIVRMVPPSVSISESLRSASMRSTLIQFGVEVYEIWHSSDGPDSTSNEIIELARSGRGTAAMFSSDLAALRFIEQAALAGLLIPEDLSVTGCDGAMIGIEQLGLATVRIPVEAVAKRAIEVMQGMLAKNGSTETVRELHAGTLLLGRSLASVKA